jgi:hypothetical protein
MRRFKTSSTWSISNGLRAFPLTFVGRLRARPPRSFGCDGAVLSLFHLVTAAHLEHHQTTFALRR